MCVSEGDCVRCGERERGWGFTAAGGVKGPKCSAAQKGHANLNTFSVE